MGGPAFERTVLAQTLSLRKRRRAFGAAFDRQFTEKQPPHKDEALRAFDRTIAMVVETIRKQTAADWGRTYAAEREPLAKDRFAIFVRCAGHAYHHVGQIVYLTKELART